MNCNAEFYYVGKIRIGRALQQQRVVLRHRNTIVGGKCTLPSALLVIAVMMALNQLPFQLLWYVSVS